MGGRDVHSGMRTEFVLTEALITYWETGVDTPFSLYVALSSVVWLDRKRRDCDGIAPVWL